MAIKKLAIMLNNNPCSGIMAGAIMTKTFDHLCIFGGPNWKNYTWPLKNRQLCFRTAFLLQNLKAESNQCSKKTRVLEKNF